MTTDIENELRDLFREKAGEAPLATPGAPAAAPPHVLRRGRRRQLGTVIGSAAAVVVLIAGSVAGLQRLLADGPEPLSTGAYDVFERTATVEAFTVTSPSDWFLVNQWPLSMQTAVEVSSGASEPCVAAPSTNTQECPSGTESAELLPLPEGLPMIQLANVDLGLDANVCEDGIPGAGAALYVALDAERAIAGIADPTIPAFPGEPGLPPEGDGPCGPGRYASFTVNGEPFFAWIGLGSSVTAEDRETVETAYERMSAIDDWTPIPPDHVTPAYVIAGGATDQYGPWRIEIRPSGSNVEMTVIGVVGATQAEFAVAERPIDWCCEGAENGVLFGAVQKGASGVEFRPGDGDAPITGTIVLMPPTLALGFDLFFLEGAEGLTGDVVAVGLGPGTETSPSPTPEPAAEVTSLSGGSDGHTWIVRFVGAFSDGTACMTLNLDGVPNGRICPRPIETSLAGRQPSMHGWMTPSFYLLAGSVPLEVQEIRFQDDDGTPLIREQQCTTGPSGWTDKQVCVVRLPAEGSGTMEYLDDEGNVLFEEGLGWDSAEAALEVPAADPVHGGTSWAVYPWLGRQGDPAANAMVGELFDRYGLQAGQGELNCDQGAAEAIGTTADWSVGVYFDTRADAEAFASQLVDAGVTNEAPIAQVTTYCLD